MGAIFENKVLQTVKLLKNVKIKLVIVKQK